MYRLDKLNSRKWTGIASGFAALLTLGSSAGVNAQSLVNHNSNAPVNYAADRIELLDRQSRVVLSGNVDISQAGLRLQAARTTVSYTNTGGLQIDRINAAGGVTVTKGDEFARGDVAVYDFDRRIITLIGNVSLRRGTDTLNGGRLVIDLRSGRSVVDGRAASGRAPTSEGGGRVSGSFSVPQRDD